MNIIAWIVLILNGLTCCIQLKDMFTKKTTKDRVISAIGASINGMTVYLMLYMLGFII